MSTTMQVLRYLVWLGGLLLLTACGSDLNTSSSSSGAGGAGVAVDPYLVGAVFEEVTADGASVIQRESTPSDAQGVFRFAQPLTPGAVVRLKVSQPGQHAGAPFQGMLRAIVTGDGVVVSPLTTLLANGVSPAALVQALNDAGLTGVTEADLTADPMVGITGRRTNVTDLLLRRLQANMVAQMYLQLAGDSVADMTSGPVSLTSMVDAVRGCLSPTVFDQMVTAVGSQVTLDKVAMAAARTQMTLVDLVRNQTGPSVSDATVAQLAGQAAADMQTLVQTFAQQTSTADGATLFAVNCNFCHTNTGAATLMDLANDGAKVRVRFTADTPSHRDNNVFTQAEIDALAVYLGEVPSTGGVDGATLFTDLCSSCHNLGNGGLMDLAGDGTKVTAKFTASVASHQGYALTAEEIAAVAAYVDAQGGGTTPPPTPTDGPGLYAAECAGCHGALASTDKPSRTAAQIQAAIDGNVGNMGYLNTLTTAEVQLIADALATIAPPAPPVTARTGQEVYDAVCAGCHAVNGYDATGSPDLAAKGSLVDAKLTSGHNSSSVLAEEYAGLATFLDSYSAPAPPVTARTGQQVYDAVCAGCHAVNGYDATGSPDLAAKGSLVDAKLTSGHNSSSVLAEEYAGLATFLDSYSAPPPPVTARSGQEVYDAVCAGCHAVNGYDATGAPDLAAKGSLVDAKLTSGHNSSSVLAEEYAGLATFLDNYTAPATGPDYSDCTACHGQPPSGTAFPDTAGAHASHINLSGINGSCASCHDGASHNGWVDLALAATWNAKSGAFVDNGDGTCSNVSCHGGQTTPVWRTGSLSVNTQCASCHSRGTTQYNSYNSGRHSKHSDYSCTSCHDTTKLATGHFQNLATTTFEQDPATTIKSSIGYNGSTCSTPSCHGSKGW